MTEPKPIPDSVLAVLRHRWRLPEEGFQHFDVAWRYPDRRSDPSYYVIRRGEKVFDLTRAEAAALVKDEVFGSKALDEGANVTINEHADHALVDFFEEVYGAWAKYLARLKQVEQQCPAPRRYA